MSAVEVSGLLVVVGLLAGISASLSARRRRRYESQAPTEGARWHRYRSRWRASRFTSGEWSGFGTFFVMLGAANIAKPTAFGVVLAVILFAVGGVYLALGWRARTHS